MMTAMANGRPFSDKALPLDASVRFGAYAADDRSDAGISPVMSA